jgi:hypothetical protein
MTESKSYATTKIYIKDFNPRNITKTVLEELDKYFRVSNNYFELYSPSGIFIIEKNKIVKLLPNDAPLKYMDFENVQLILDNSYFKEEEILSQIPFHNFHKETTRFYYSQGDDSKSKEKVKLQLIVEGHYENKLNRVNAPVSKRKQKYTDFVVDKFYFLAKEELDNYLMKKELNVFLSLLK